MLSKVVLHNDNAWPHMAAATAMMIHKLKFELHPAHGLDLPSSDYYIFRPLKDAFCGHWFASNEEVKVAMHMWYCMELKMFYEASSWTREAMWKCGRLQHKMKVYLLFIFLIIKKLALVSHLIKELLLKIQHKGKHFWFILTDDKSTDIKKWICIS